MMFPVKVLQRKSILYTLFIFFLLHLWRYINRKAWLSFAKTKRNLEILKKCPTITKKTFLPCVYLQHHFIQTILAGFVPSKEKDPDFQIEEVSIKGGGHTTLAWATYNRLDYVTNESDRQNSAHKGNNILIVVIPGITGTLEDHYVKDMVNALSNAKYRSVVYLPRLNGQRMIIPDEGVVNNIDDLKATMEHIRSQEPGVKLFGIGHSFGANLLMNFLGKYNEDNGFVGGVSLANPFNFVLAENKLRRSIIGQALTKFQKARILKSKKELAGLLKFEFNLDDLHAFKTLRDFDENFMIKLLGFETPDDYYWDLSSFRRMKSIKVPLFMLQSEDDPTADIHAFVREGFDKRNPNVILMMTSKGGHQGWIEGFFSLSRWYLKPTLEFVNAVVSTLEK